jgi:hypothetical protein
MKLDFDAVDSSLDFVEEIGGVPDSTITLNAAGTNFQVPITETIPATGPAYVRLTAELSDSVGTYLVHDIQYWPLQ